VVNWISLNAFLENGIISIKQEKQMATKKAAKKAVKKVVKKK
jgi:hypothetical protein